ALWRGGISTMAPRREQKKRLGKKHRQASTRPKLGKTAPRATATTGAVSPKKRKELAAKKAAATKAAKTPTRSPEKERHIVLGQRDANERQATTRPRAVKRPLDPDAAEQREWR